MSRELPILFNTDMVREILDGRKTVTRRVVKEKGPVPDDAVWGFSALTPKGRISCRGTFTGGYGERFLRVPYQPADILYVRETWCNANKEGAEPDYYYYADTSVCEDYCKAEWKWRPSIHMPKAAARIWLKVTDVRVERLQEIDGHGVLTEGIDNRKSNPANGKRWENMQQMAFSELWNSTIKKADIDKYGWDANPWVWVIEFERCEKPEVENV